jgi:(p)ppGpp synthase/HD superfamily hydrolase
MRAIADDPRSVFNDEVLGGASARSSRAAERFARLPIAQAALEFASERHAGQYREIDRAPFIAHPIEVGWLLRCDGQPDEVIAAGLLHDLVEKTATTSAERQRLLGARIAQVVETVSDDQSIGDYEARKRDLRARVAHADTETAAIFASDKIAKVRELAASAASTVATSRNEHPRQTRPLPREPRDAPPSRRDRRPRRPSRR